MADEIQKMDLESKDLVAERIEEMKKLFPEIAVEGEGSIDFEKLRLILGDEVDEGQERYAFTWPGKADAIRQAQIPSTATLRPDEVGSVNWDTTENLYIEGDNLEVLKLLQRGYHGKVKMIYIDPPYNTGHDFVYKDSFQDSIENYKEQAGLGGQSNADASGRYHSDWLSMIYPRLRLARELLSDDGVIFISIGEEESSTLKTICSELFGEKNFVGNLVWQSRTSISNDYEISGNHNHTFVYAKDIDNLVFGGDPIDGSEYSNPDNDPRGPWKCVPMDANHAGGDTQFGIVNPNTGEEYFPPNGRSWAYNRQTVAEMMDDGRIAFGTTGNSAPKRKLFLNERIEKGDTKTPSSLLLDAGTTKNGTEEIMQLMGDKVFDFPKPTSLIERLIDYGNPRHEGIVMDFFSGSGTTANAVISSNAKTGKTMKFILVQLDEDMDQSLTTASLDPKKTLERGIRLLDEIGKPHVLTKIAEERIRRAGKKLLEDIAESNKQLKLGQEPKDTPDIGFRVLKLDTSCLSSVNDGALFDNLVKPDRSNEDVIFEMMLKWGLELSLPMEKTEVLGYPITSIAADELICCMDKGLNVEILEAIAELEPKRVFFLDSVLTDTIKLNAAQIFKRVGDKLGIEIELRTV